MRSTTNGLPPSRKYTVTRTANPMAGIRRADCVCSGGAQPFTLAALDFALLYGNAAISIALIDRTPGATG